MAYNNFPIGYQPAQIYYPQPQQSGNQMPQQNGYAQPQNNLIWVQGEAGAKSYLVAPNQTVQLWDSESQTIYLKSADASGMPSIKVLDYTIRDNAPRSPEIVAQNDFATKDDILLIQDEITALKAKFERMSNGAEKQKEQKEREKKNG